MFKRVPANLIFIQNVNPKLRDKGSSYSRTKKAFTSIQASIQVLVTSTQTELARYQSVCLSNRCYQSMMILETLSLRINTAGNHKFSLVSLRLWRAF